MKDIKTSFMIPEDIWKAAKVQAAQEGISLGELIRNLLSEYLEKKAALPKKKKEGR
jgi:predicted HicB family RNase H-like nuclease